MKVVLSAVSSVMTALVFIAAPIVASAQVVDLSGDPITLQGQKVYPQATVHTPKGDVTVKLTGRGVRTKLGGFIKVYVAASYVADLDAWHQATKAADLYTDPQRKSLTAAVAAQPVRVLVLNMLTTLNPSSIQTSFTEGLKANDLPLTTPGLQEVLNRFDETLKSGESAVIATFADGDQQTLVVEALGKSEHVTAPDLGNNFWKIWFAKSNEKELLALQKLLVGSSK